MKEQAIEVNFPTPDYAVVMVNGKVVKSLSAESDQTSDAFTMIARQRLKERVRSFCEGIECGYGEARFALQETMPKMRTRL